jgi:hypothetical protein
MVVILAMGIGLFAPPFGVGYYGACAISKVNPDEGLRYIWGYMLALLVGPRRRRRRALVLHRLPVPAHSASETRTMSRFFGEIRQLGYVVPDIEAAMDYWSRVLGVGPFFYNPRVPIKNYRYKGESFEPHNSVALANSGAVAGRADPVPQRRAVHVQGLHRCRA